MVRQGGFEPPTFWSVARRSIQLSYRRISCPVKSEGYCTFLTRRVREAICSMPIGGKSWSRTNVFGFSVRHANRVRHLPKKLVFPSSQKVELPSFYLQYDWWAGRESNSLGTIKPPVLQTGVSTLARYRPI